MASEDEEIRRMLVELRILEGSARVVQSRVDVVNAAIGDVAVAHATLEGVKTQSEGSETLIPVGGGSFVRAKLADVQKMIMGVGAGVCIERSVDESIAELKARLGDLDKVRASLQEQLGQTLLKIEEQRNKLGELVKKRGGESLTVV